MFKIKCSLWVTVENLCISGQLTIELLHWGITVQCKCEIAKQLIWRWGSRLKGIFTCLINSNPEILSYRQPQEMFRELTVLPCFLPLEFEDLFLCHPEVLDEGQEASDSLSLERLSGCRCFLMDCQCSGELQNTATGPDHIIIWTSVFIKNVLSRNKIFLVSDKQKKLLYLTCISDTLPLPLSHCCDSQRQIQRPAGPVHSPLKRTLFVRLELSSNEDTPRFLPYRSFHGYTKELRLRPGFDYHSEIMSTFINNRLFCWEKSSELLKNCVIFLINWNLIENQFL